MHPSLISQWLPEELDLFVELRGLYDLGSWDWFRLWRTRSPVGFECHFQNWIWKFWSFKIKMDFHTLEWNLVFNSLGGCECQSASDWLIWSCGFLQTCVFQFGQLQCQVCEKLRAHMRIPLCKRFSAFGSFGFWWQNLVNLAQNTIIFFSSSVYGSKFDTYVGKTLQWWLFTQDYWAL